PGRREPAIAQLDVEAAVARAGGPAHEDVVVELGAELPEGLGVEPYGAQLLDALAQLARAQVVARVDPAQGGHELLEPPVLHARDADARGALALEQGAQL